MIVSLHETHSKGVYLHVRRFLQLPAYVSLLITVSKSRKDVDGHQGHYLSEVGHCAVSYVDSFLLELCFHISCKYSAQAFVHRLPCNDGLPNKAFLDLVHK